MVSNDQHAQSTTALEWMQGTQGAQQGRVHAGPSGVLSRPSTVSNILEMLWGCYILTLMV